MSTKLYVGNLPFQTTESDLQTLFETVGAVSTINIVRDRATGQARGFAFVEMSDDEGAKRAISELDKHQYGGRNLTVNEAKPMTPRGKAAAVVAVAAAWWRWRRPSASRVALVETRVLGSRHRRDPGLPLRSRRACPLNSPREQLYHLQ